MWVLWAGHHVVPLVHSALLHSDFVVWQNMLTEDGSFSGSEAGLRLQCVCLGSKTEGSYVPELFLRVVAGPVLPLHDGVPLPTNEYTSVV